MKNYQIICMSFDGEYKRESPTFETIESTWDYANDLGSKWFFYPFYFVATEKTIIDSPIKNLIGKRIKTVKLIFNELSKEPELAGASIEDFELALRSIDF